MTTLNTSKLFSHGRLSSFLRIIFCSLLLLKIQFSNLCDAQQPDVSDPCASAATQQHFGDIAYFPSLDEIAESRKEEATQRKRRGATANTNLLWPNGIVIYSFSDQFTEGEKVKVIEAMRHWEENTCIRFHDRTNQTSYINFFQGSGCCSYIGYLGYGRQGVSLAKKCLKFPVIVHEIGHAIGFWHEHTRPDRDNYVDVLYDNIEEGYERNFKKLSSSVINSHGVGYDYNSIMHYNRNFFAKVQGLHTLRPATDDSIPLGLAVELSPMDIEQTKRLYSGTCGQMNASSTLPDVVTPNPPTLPFACGKILSQTDGSFTSPQHPAAYPTNTDCAWLIQPQGNFLITLEFYNVAIESRPLCDKDYIHVFDGTNENGIKRAKICGWYPNYPSITVGRGAIYIHFHSDNNTQLRGFSARYRSSDLNECAGGSSCSQNCRNTFGGHVCSCRNGFYLSADGRTCFDINECGTNNGGCSDVCTNTGGSYICSCNSGRVLQSNQLTCRRPGPSCNVQNGGCHHNCTETTDARICSCLSGFRLEPDQRTCFDINECYSTGHGCAHKCVNTLGSYHCACHPSYHLNPDNRTCVPDRVCRVNNGGCDQRCRSGGDGSALCYCRRGYRLASDGITCKDIDECEEQRRVCEQVCINTNGSYRCGCREGYGLTSDQIYCRNLDECQLGIDECQFHDYCRDTTGSYTCRCPPGFVLGQDRHSCIDIDECEYGYKYICTHGCRNLLGTYECTCPRGYVLQSQWNCVDVDECAISHRCNYLTGARCKNTEGAYTCLCPEGFKTDNSGWNCIDVDECSNGTYHCEADMQCVNMVGYYICQQPATNTAVTSTTSSPTNAATTTNREVASTGNTATPSSTELSSSTGVSATLSSVAMQSTTSARVAMESTTTLTTVATDNSASQAIKLPEQSRTSSQPDQPGTTDTRPRVTLATSTDRAPPTSYSTLGEAISTTSTPKRDLTPGDLWLTSTLPAATNSDEDVTQQLTTEQQLKTLPTSTDSEEDATSTPKRDLTPEELWLTSTLPAATNSDEDVTQQLTTEQQPKTLPTSTDSEEDATQQPATDLSPITPTESGCGGFLTSENGSFSSGNWPNTYPVNVDCQWMISLSSHQLIEISFEANPFGIAGRLPTCKKDWVKIASLGKNQTVVKERGPFCSFTVPNSFVTETSIARVQFHSGSRHGSARKGFKLYYQALDVCTPIAPPLTVINSTFDCTVVIGLDEKFGPPEFPNYITTRTRQSCIWLYHGTSSTQLRLMYFDLPVSKDCAENSLRVYSGLTKRKENLITTLCGHLGKDNRLIQLDTRYLLIELHVSTQDATFRGFHAVLQRR